MMICKVCDGNGYKLGKSDFEKGFHARGPKSFEKSKITCKFCKGKGFEISKNITIKKTFSGCDFCITKEGLFHGIENILVCDTCYVKGAGPMGKSPSWNGIEKEKNYG